MEKSDQVEVDEPEIDEEEIDKLRASERVSTI